MTTPAPPPDTTFLPYGRQWIDEADIAAVTAVLRGERLTQGPAVDAFEAGLARCTGAPHAVACANGTAALYLMAQALELGPGDAAVVPAITFLATANAIRLTGADVAFADVDPATGLMTADGAAAAMDRAARAGWRVRALFPVHLAGQTADMDALARLAHTHGAAVVEDACHALGSERDRAGQPAAETVGACHDSDAAVFSFHPVKTVTAGEGGAITVRDAALAGRLRLLRNHGMTRDPAAFTRPDLAFGPDGRPNPWYYEMAVPSLNQRITDLQCALALSQLDRLALFVSRRRELADAYDRALAPLAPLIRPLARTPGCRAAWHLYVVRIDFAALGRSRAEVMETLQKAGIGTQVHYIPVSWQPYYRDRYGDIPLPGAAAYYEAALSLPLFPAMDDGDVRRVADALAGLAG